LWRLDNPDGGQCGDDDSDDSNVDYDDERIILRMRMIEVMMVVMMWAEIQMMARKAMILFLLHLASLEEPRPRGRWRHLSLAERRIMKRIERILRESR
jgi:hypothetical protein